MKALSQKWSIPGTERPEGQEHSEQERQWNEVGAEASPEDLVHHGKEFGFCHAQQKAMRNDPIFLL